MLTSVEPIGTSVLVWHDLPNFTSTQLFSKLGTLYNKASKQEHLTSIMWLRRMYELYITPDNYV